MHPTVSEWLNLLLRWAHIIAGIAWIGSSFFFMWLDRTIHEGGRPAGAPGGLEGELWMVHGGGFYRVEKSLVAPSQMPPVLHWFRWEAMLTLITGYFLLGVVYYMGGLLVDPHGGRVGAGAAAAIGLGVLTFSWFVYDLLWRSPLERWPWAGSAVSLALAALLAWGLSEVMSGRSAYIHVGAVLGTLMVSNVWMVIIPAQRALVAAIKEGRTPDAARARRAKLRSVHNNYMTYPVIFIMISNHFGGATTQGYNWVMLAALALAGAGARHWMNVRRASGAVVTAGAVVLLACAVLAIRPSGGNPGPRDDGEEEGTEKSDDKEAQLPLWQPPEAGKAAAVEGVVRLAGAPPKAKTLDMRAEPACAAAHGGSPPASDEVRLAGGKLAGAVVHVARGLEAWRFPAVSREAVIDQKGCVYRPRITAVRAGQPVAFTNSDPVNHNVRLTGDLNPGDNVSMPNQTMRVVKRFARPELAIKATCDVHPWMAARIAVLRHPFFQVTGEDGKFRLEGLPPGEYEIEAWHEVLGTKRVTIRLEAGKTAQIELAIESGR